MNDAAERSYKQQDDLLNRLYARLYAKLQPESRPALTRAERAWITYQDSECAFETQALGEVKPMVLASCEEYETRQRIKEIRSQLDCPEGGLNCPP